MRTITRDQRRADRERTLNRRTERRNKYAPPVVAITRDMVTNFEVAL